MLRHTWPSTSAAERSQADSSPPKARWPQALAPATDLDVVALELRIDSHQHELLDLRLRHQKSIEWIAVVHRKLSHPQGVRVLDCEAATAAGRLATWHVTTRRTEVRLCELPATHPARLVLELTPRQWKRLRQDSAAKAAA